MLSKERILSFIEPLLADKQMFMISLDISTSNKIRLVIDSKQGVKIDDCVAFSRAIEHNLDREQEDFELEVSSAGLTEAFRVREQYVKNLGREVEVLLKTGRKLSGKLMAVEENEFSIEQVTMAKTEGKKKKQSRTEILSIRFGDCSKVRLRITFK